MAVSFSDLQLAFEFVSSGGRGENEAYLDRQSGKIYWHSEFGDNDEELPDDIDDEKYISIPVKGELDLGQPLVLDFVREFLPDDYDEVRHIFSRRGAYRRYKDLLVRRGALEQWYDFSSKSEETALREWCMEKRDRTQRYLRSRCCYLPLALTKAWDIPKPAPLLSRALIHPSQNGVWSSMMRIAEPRGKVARANRRMVTSSRPL